eukprot:jgi/Picsp_1/3392/NSC_06230-R1_expressed protein [Chlorella variabilis]
MTRLTQHLSKRGMSRSVGGCGLVSKRSRCARYDAVYCVGSRDAMGCGLLLADPRPVTGGLFQSPRILGDDISGKDSSVVAGGMLRSGRKGMVVAFAMAKGRDEDGSQNADRNTNVDDGGRLDKEQSVEHFRDGDSPGIGQMLGEWFGAVVSSFEMMSLPSWRWHVPGHGAHNTLRYRMYQNDAGYGNATHRGVMHSANLPEGLVETVGVLDAQDAMEACGGLWGHEKEECFSVFGVDKDADLWFDVVSKLEQALERETDPDEDAFHHGKERC